MPSRTEISYFGAGPAPLPTPVLEAGARAFVNYEDSGLSLAEISHRSPTANKILADTKAALASLLDIPTDEYEILFMHGGGSGEFSAVVFNMVAYWVEQRRRIAEKDLGPGKEAEVLERVRQEVRSDLKCDYLVTGSWTLKASQEAANLLAPLSEQGDGKCFVNIATDARRDREGKFGTITPEEEWQLSDQSKAQSAFVYYCDNETVDGVEFPSFPIIPEKKSGDLERLVVADMSSNFLTRKVDVRKHAVIFGGAQKNIGITDVTITIVRKDILNNMPDPTFLHKVGVWSPPVVLNWAVVAKNNSLYNTMPIFSIWIAGEVMRSLLTLHGDDKVSGQERVTNEKAKLLYGILDKHSSFYKVVPDSSCRSRMNICFRVGEGAEAEKKFLDGAEKLNLQGLKGHRSVGGIRISNYNAVTMESVEKLARYLEEAVR